jgi:hypothetical protein
MSLRVQQRAVAGFLEWAAVRGVLDGEEQADQWRQRLEIMLQARRTYLSKPDATRWRSGDVHQLLMEYVVPRQVDLWELAEHGVAVVRQFLRFLDETDRLHPASTKVPTLLRELDRLAAQYPAAMADSSRYWLAKRVFTAMDADGVDITDQAAADVWAAAFTARDPAGRRSVLGELMDRDPGYATGPLVIHDMEVAVLLPGAPADKSLVWPDARGCGCAQHEYPDATLPPPAALAAAVAAEGGDLLRRLQRLAAWVGPEGKPVNRRGELAKQDVHSVAEAFELPTDGVNVLWDLLPLSGLWLLAIEFDVLTVYRTRVLPGSSAALVEAALHSNRSGEALELWADIFDELARPSPPLDSSAKTDATRKWMQIWPPQFLSLLYSRCPNGEFADFDELSSEMLTGHRMLPKRDTEMFTETATLIVAKTLADLDDHGGVQVSGLPWPALPPGAEQAHHWIGTLAPAMLFKGTGVQVRLTDLGRYALQRQLLPHPAHAPAPAATTSS